MCIDRRDYDTEEILDEKLKELYELWIKTEESESGEKFEKSESIELFVGVVEERLNKFYKEEQKKLE